MAKFKAIVLLIAIAGALMFNYYSCGFGMYHGTVNNKTHQTTSSE